MAIIITKDKFLTSATTETDNPLADGNISKARVAQVGVIKGIVKLIKQKIKRMTMGELGKMCKTSPRDAIMKAPKPITPKRKDPLNPKTEI